MRKWIAGTLAALLLLTGGPAAAWEDTREENSGTAELLRTAVKLLQDEDVRNLLRLQDVKALLGEGVFRTLAWMLRNRPVTMQILEELGAGEEELRCVGKIWDSAERIEGTVQAWLDRVENRQLKADLEAMKADPEFPELLNRIARALRPEGDPEQIPDRIIGILESTAQEGPDDPLQRVLEAALKENEILETIREEGRILSADPALKEFFLDALQEAADLIPLLMAGEEKTTGEEDAP